MSVVIAEAFVVFPLDVPVLLTGFPFISPDLERLGEGTEPHISRKPTMLQCTKFPTPPAIVDSSSQDDLSSLYCSIGGMEMRPNS
ncbi:unnamed protein product [Taenia asiatica]|uniref:Secreted protein n=1 Tax=Taenia asiatica TaxID=60517 RepID=A0A0R3WED2_TAEAS|nr:unnamed protein product [Taenia asiatica]